MDCFDIAEKELRNKAPAASTEQPAKEVKNSEVSRGKWNGLNYARALINSGLSGEARILADHVYTNQGKTYKFHERKLLNDTGLSRVKLYRAMAELEEVNAIERDRIRNGPRWEKGVSMKWNFEYQTWKRKNDSYQNDNYQNDNYQNDNYQNDNDQNDNDQNDHCINIDKDLISPPVAPLPPGNSEHGSKKAISLNSEHGEKREGAAAKPQPAPALSKGAENVPEESAAQNAPGEASQESSFPETAQGQQNGNKYHVPLSVPEVMKQGQTDLFGEAAPLPEKPKKERKAKPFTPPTKEEVRLELESLLAKKGTNQQWSDNDLRAMTEKFFEHYNTRNWEKSNGQKLKDWRASLNTTWLLKQNYLPDRTTRNQPQGQSFKQAQREKLQTNPQGLAIDRIIGLVESGTATLEGLGITDPEIVRMIKNEIARRRGSNTAPLLTQN